MLYYVCIVQYMYIAIDWMQSEKRPAKRKEVGAGKDEEKRKKRAPSPSSPNSQLNLSTKAQRILTFLNFF